MSTEPSKATPHDKLIERLMDVKCPHTECEVAARLKIGELREGNRQLQKEVEYRHRAMCYFASQVDNYSHIGKPNVIGDIIGFWDIAREQGALDSGFTVPTGDLFHEWGTDELSKRVKNES